MDACLAVLAVLERRIGGYRLRTEVLPGGAAHYRDTGTALSEENFRKAEAADAILFGAMGLPDVRYPDGTEIAPHLEMRRASVCSPGCARSRRTRTLARRLPTRAPATSIS